MQQLTIENFDPHVGQEFAVDGAGALTLTEVGALPASSREGVPFRLLFRGPVESILAQGTYRLRRGESSFDIFIVPLQPDAGGAQYEAIFN